MLFEKRINREVERRMYEENLRREMRERLERQQKQIEDLRVQIECLKACNVPVTEARDG